MSVKQIVQNSRYKLIGSFMHFVDGSQGEKGKLLTETAITQGFIEARKPVSGQQLKKWLRDRNPPTWAVKAATKLLKATEFIPQEEDERVSWAYYLRETGEMDTLSDTQRESIEKDLMLIDNLKI